MPEESMDNDGQESREQIEALEAKIQQLKAQLAEAAQAAEQCDEAEGKIAALAERNSRLMEMLQGARNQLNALREEVDRLAQPPSGYGVFLRAYDDNTIDAFTSGRKMRLAVAPNVDAQALRRGEGIRLNEALTVVEACGFERTGEIC